MEVIRALIVDDEVKSQQTLKNLVEKYCTDVEIVGIASGVDEGLELIRELDPALLFLDIQMSHKNGFDLLDEVAHYRFDVIFTTAYETYAITAFKYSATNYLLKPIDIDELIAAIDLLRRKKGEHNSKDQIELLFKSLNAQKSSQRIALPTQTGLQFINVDNIVRLESEGNYTTFYLLKKDKIISSKNLKEYEDLLLQHNFIRIHHSHLINIDHIQEYVKSDGGYVIMADGSTVTISRRKKDDFLKKVLKR